MSDFNIPPLIQKAIFRDTHFWSIPAFISKDKFIIASWDACITCYDINNFEPIWVFQTGGPIYSSPIVLDEESFIIGGEDGVLRKINNQGILQWEFKAKGRFHSNPTIDNAQKIVFATCYDHHVYALDSFTGEIIWKRVFNAETIEDIYSTPALTKNNNIIFGTDKRVICLDDKGIELWSFEVSGYVDSTALIDNDNGIGIIGSFDNYIYAFDINNGVVLWKYLTNGEVKTSAAIHNNIVAIGSDDGSVYGLDIITGILKWSNFTGQEMQFTPLSVLPNGNFCFVTLDQSLWCLDFKTGETIWKKKFLNFGVHSAPVLNNYGQMIIGSNNGAFFILKFQQKEDNQ